jgi:hypothetical protein
MAPSSIRTADAASNRSENPTILSRCIFRFTRKYRIVRVAENLEVNVASSVAPAPSVASPAQDPDLLQIQPDHEGDPIGTIARRETRKAHSAIEMQTSRQS